jgi:hypothetical protein
VIHGKEMFRFAALTHGVSLRAACSGGAESMETPVVLLSKK